jgi:CxxC-x17-CxxC domain-containing protein
MRNFNNDRGGFKNFSDRSFGGGNRGGSFGGNRGGFDRNRNDRQMFDAVCDKCGQNCQVPFQPTGEKPVYCSSCFEKTSGREGGSERSFGANRDFGGGNRDFGGGNRKYEARDTKDYQHDNTRSEIEALNKKIDRILDLLLTKDIKAPAMKLPQIKAKKVKKTKKVEALVETKE